MGVMSPSPDTSPFSPSLHQRIDDRLGHPSSGSDSRKDVVFGGEGSTRKCLRAGLECFSQQAVG